MALILLCTILGTAFHDVTAHVALSYPPARKYDLDFLDNARTPEPCGMPKGNITTTLIKGSTVPVTWHLGYPHQGGFLLELLDENEQHKMYLSSVTGEYTATDTTAQSYDLKLPDNLECRGCSIRLLRQALEWGGSYRFWSCADVDIVPRTEASRNCNGNGRYFSNRCLCDKRFFGDECQYENECENDDDCGRFGQCVDIGATTYPKKQCFCSKGYFGPKCSKSSHIRSETQINLGVYTKKELSNAVTLYWKVLKAEGEIEVVLVNKGTSYVALGWRPSDITSSCRLFPKIDGPPPPKITRKENYSSAISPEASAEPEPKSEPEAKSEPDSKSEPESQPKTNADSRPALIAEPKPEVEPEPESEPESQGKIYGKSASAKEPSSGTLEQEAKPKKTNLSLAERLANFSGRKKRSPQSGGHQMIASPLLKPARQASTTINETDPTAKSEPEPEVTGEPRSKPETEAEREPKAEPETEAETSPEADPNTEPEAEPESAARGNQGSESSPYAPKGSTLHEMDCTDIVVGMARGNLYRVMDYYTRDRSTPRVDAYWGGEDSLTAVFGWERDGETTILFRKPLTATHQSDHSFVDKVMEVIWSRGQEPNMYIHSPQSGLEVGNHSIPDFYRPDELKYHGKGGQQRGDVEMNFFEQARNLAEAGSEEINWCGGQWKYPHSCSLSKKECEYYAKWEFLEDTDEIQFSVSANNTNLWTGIGFSDDTSMPKSDVVLGWMTPQGKYFMYDGWLQEYKSPIVDENQGISNLSASQEDGITTLHFARKRQSNDSKDMSFTDERCLYMLFPVKGGSVNYVNKRISKHQLTPTVSSQRICIRSCTKFGGADGKPIVYTTTPRPPELQYNVEFKITNTGENMKVPRIGTQAYNTLINQVTQSTQGVFEKLPGFVVADVINLDDSEPEKVKATVQLTLNKAAQEESMGTIKTEEDQKRIDNEVRRVIENSVKTGRIGQLAVEPAFLRVDLLKANLQAVSENSTAVTTDSASSNALEFLDKNKYWFIGAGIVALIILAILQGIVTACRKTRNAVPAVSTKERLINNSRWKDYSRGASNYAYESYDVDREVDSRRLHSIRKEEGRGGAQYKNGRPSGNSPKGHMNGTTKPSEMAEGLDDSRSPSGGYGDTRSLQRPRNVPLSDPRTTYSLPRGSSANSSPPSYSTAMQDLTPDFYYLPSQRKYSGEVVRVYVDYNKAK